MKNKFVNRVVVMLLLISVMLAGCGKQSSASSVSNEPQSVSIVRRVTKNVPMVSLNSENIYEKIYEAAYTYGEVSAVSVEGTPKVVCNFDLKEPDKKIDDSKRKQIANDNTEVMLTELSAIASTTPEADTLSSIKLSAETLQSTSSEEKTMIIFDSGLSTTGLLNFAQQNIIDTPVNYIVDQLEELHAVPDLTGIDVIWVGLGKVSGEQPELTDNYKYKLEELWKAILTSGGAKGITFDTSPVSGEGYTGELPQCSIVPVVQDSLDTEQLVTESEMPEVMKWDGESSVTFKGDKAEFNDYEAAAEELAPIAEYLKANPEENIYVFGMTATITGGDSGIELAEERAEAVRGVLIEKGAKETQCICVGLGQISNPLRVNDVDENGKQIAELAQKNRAVFVIRGESDMINVLWECLENVNV